MQCKTYMCVRVSQGRWRATLLVCYPEAYAGQKSHGRCANLVDKEGVSVLIQDSWLAGK